MPTPITDAEAGYVGTDFNFYTSDSVKLYVCVDVARKFEEALRSLVSQAELINDPPWQFTNALFAAQDMLKEKNVNQRDLPDPLRHSVQTRAPLHGKHGQSDRKA